MTEQAQQRDGIAVYEVRFRDDPEIVHCHLNRESARSHIERLRRIGIDDAHMREDRRDCLSNQQVTISGDVARCQFSRTRMGVRTVRRRVSGIHERGGALFGRALFMGRTLLVAHVAADWWRAIGIVAE